MSRHRGIEMRNGKIAFGRYCADLNWLVVAFILLLALGPIAVAQSPKVLTLEQAVDFALKNYPAVRASLERVSAAQAGVGLARTSYLPRADMLWQRNQATAESSVTRLDVAVATVNAYLTVLAAEQTVQAARADVERRETFNKAVRVLVDNQLRAGADASRADAELARARVNLARAQQQEQVSRAVLADILGMPDTSVEVRASSLLGPPPNASSQTTPITDHPIAKAEHARVDEALSQVRILERAYYPKFYFQSAVFGRGSGFAPAGNFLGGTNGLGLDRSNWATGVTVTFPVFDIFTIRSRKAVETANERAEAARYDQTLQDLTGQFRKAQASLEGARHVAENTPLELDAARTTENQERARYQAGLATLVDVADAQSLLVQAETDDALARLAVWQNLASVAASQGDLQPFLQFLHQKTQGGP